MSGGPTDGATAVVHTAANEFEAGLVASSLESAEIPARVFRAGSTRAAAPGISPDAFVVVVSAAREAEALRLLAETVELSGEPGEEAPGADAGEPLGAARPSPVGRIMAVAAVLLSLMLLTTLAVVIAAMIRG